MPRGVVRPRSPGVWQISWDGPRGEAGKRNQKSKIVRGDKKAAQAELMLMVSDLNKTK
jgi:hypothetical protein